MSSMLFTSRVDHCRAGPQVHRFHYGAVSVLVDLDRWGESDRFVSFDRLGLFSLMRDDYLPGRAGSVKERLQGYLSQGGVTREWTRVELLTSPRFCGYVFNPVNFYLCYGANTERPELCVAEVNNTFGETHLYVTRADETNSSRRVPRFRAAKEFHVSPFFERKGTYEFFVERGRSMIDIRVNLCRDGKPVFTSGITGELSPPKSRFAAALAGIRHSWLTGPRIALQAAILYFPEKASGHLKTRADVEVDDPLSTPHSFRAIGRCVVIQILRRTTTR